MDGSILYLLLILFDWVTAYLVAQSTRWGHWRVGEGAAEAACAAEGAKKEAAFGIHTDIRTCKRSEGGCSRSAAPSKEHGGLSVDVSPPEFLPFPLSGAI